MFNAFLPASEFTFGSGVLPLKCFPPYPINILLNENFNLNNKFYFISGNEVSLIEKVYKKCVDENKKDVNEIKNLVTEIYNPFSDDQISSKISQMLKEKDIKADVEVIFQSIDNLHKACPDDLGDWYFSGDYPTPGGNKVVNQAYINYYEGSNSRAY